MTAELCDEFPDILTSELPFEGTSSGFPIILKIEEALGKGIEIGKVIGGEHLGLDNREVDLDLVEPAGMDGRMDYDNARMPLA